MRVRRVAAIAIVAGSACVAGLSTREQRVVTTDITSHNFGTLPVGTGSDTPTITISPQTGSDDNYVTNIDFSSQCPDFTLNLTNSLPAHIFCEGSGASTGRAAGTGGGSNCIPHVFPFTATFKPSFPGMQSCNVRIAYTGSGGGSGSGSGSNNGFAMVMLSGSGMSQTRSWTVSPNQVQFGDVPTNTTSTSQPITIVNTGTQALTVSGNHTNQAQFPVSGAPLGSHTLGVGSSEQYDVVCQPGIATGPLTGSITFSAPPLTPQTVDLLCRGITSSVNVAPNPATFAYTLVGRSPADKIVTLTNGGSTPVTLSNFHIGAGASPDLTIVSSPPDNTMLLASGTTQVVLHNAATTPNTGSLGTIVFDVNLVNSQNIAVSGDAQIGSIGTNPASIEFGPVCVGEAPVKPLAIYANAPGKVDVSSVTAPTNAQLSATSTSGTLQGNHGNDLMVNATLTGATPATIDDKLTINSNLVMQPAIDVPIHGVVLPAGVAASPDLVHFGPALIDKTSTAREIVISNCATGPLMVTEASIAGTDAGEFAIVSPPDPARMLGAGESMAFLVVMTPHGIGMKSAQFVVTHVQGMTAADLDGTGYSGSDTGGNKDRETYYACSAGGTAAGVWPILLALLALRRRRK